MKAYQGILERVGNGEWINGMAKISVIKIGGTLLSNVGVEDRMSSFLDIDRPMTIYIHRLMFVRKIVIGVSHDDGDKVSMRLRTLLYFIFSTSFIWIFLGTILWLGFTALFGYISCSSYPIPVPADQQIFNICMSNAKWMGAVASIGLYIACIAHLVKDYLLVRGLTLLGK